MSRLRYISRQLGWAWIALLLLSVVRPMAVSASVPESDLCEMQADADHCVGLTALDAAPSIGADGDSSGDDGGECCKSGCSSSCQRTCCGGWGIRESVDLMTAELIRQQDHGYPTWILPLQTSNIFHPPKT